MAQPTKASVAPLSHQLFVRTPSDPRDYDVLDERGEVMGRVFVDGDSTLAVLHYRWINGTTGNPTKIRAKKDGFSNFMSWYEYHGRTSDDLKITMDRRGGPITPQ